MACEAFAVTLEDNKRKVLSYIHDVLDGHNTELIRDLFHADAVAHAPGRDVLVHSGIGRPALNTSHGTVVHHIWAEGDLVGVRLTHTVTFHAGADFVTRMGPVKTGAKTIVWDAHPVFRFEGERIAEEWIIRDELNIALQAGDVTAAAGV